VCVASRIEFLLKTDCGYPRDAEVTLFTLANPDKNQRTYYSYTTVCFVDPMLQNRYGPGIKCCFESRVFIEN